MLPCRDEVKCKFQEELCVSLKIKAVGKQQFEFRQNVLLLYILGSEQA